ncbi:HpcH/HpaI aldolase family protein [Spirabiliibacterium falconis]|uniref:HpcH/HpaI aldolase family protein n=1 Tax=Spirabiliibacterium falconis TaxID=572023 RepID=UPI001AAC5626|nr:aldolase/citrate lyase family protein [Spirabiliibacterium falconis]MBE2894896.1 2,4-dihydroxyhept-2-ene-1,7-dioic acid aldolase [Spirabiliibacterium falconis]
MRENSLLTKFKHNKACSFINGWLSFHDAYSAEVIAHSGLDSVTIDMQHGMLDFENAIHMLQAISTSSAVPLLRVSSCESAEIMKALDAGAYGIICPQVDNQAICEKFVNSCLYPPLGNRSFGPSRGLLYGGTDYIYYANDEILTLAMIESVEAINNLDSILSVEHLKGIYIGPNDLALSLGIEPGKPSEKLEQNINYILNKAKERNLLTGIFCSTAQIAKQRVKEGFNLITPGNDANILKQAYISIIENIRADISTKKEPSLTTKSGY